MSSEHVEHEANPTVNGGRSLGGGANPSNDGRVYGALARAAAMTEGYEKWWEVTRWPLDSAEE